MPSRLFLLVNRELGSAAIALTTFEKDESRHDQCGWNETQYERQHDRHRLLRLLLTPEWNAQHPRWVSSQGRMLLETTGMVAVETAGNSPKGRPLAHMLALLVVSMLVPVAILTGTLIWRVGRLDRENANQQALQLARGISGDVDREIEGSVETLLALSTSSALQRGDFEAFHRQAKETMAFRKLNVYLKSIDGRQILNTRIPWGGPLPELPPTEHDLEIIRTQQPAVSNLVIGAVTQNWVLGL